jgi:hypothetical protein
MERKKLKRYWSQRFRPGDMVYYGTRTAHVVYASLHNVPAGEVPIKLYRKGVETRTVITVPADDLDHSFCGLRPGQEVVCNGKIGKVAVVFDTCNISGYQVPIKFTDNDDVCLLVPLKGLVLSYSGFKAGEMIIHNEKPAHVFGLPKLIVSEGEVPIMYDIDAARGIYQIVPAKELIRWPNPSDQIQKTLGKSV